MGSCPGRTALSAEPAIRVNSIGAVVISRNSTLPRDGWGALWKVGTSSRAFLRSGSVLLGSDLPETAACGGIA